MDWHYKLARRLALRYDTICPETLVFKGMQKLWGRKISDLAPHQFFTVLEYVASKLGSKIVHINKWVSTTQTCNICNTVRNKKLKLSTRKWKCRACNSRLDRDTNSARNILREGGVFPLA